MGRRICRYTTEYGETYNQPVWNEHTRKNFYDRINERQNSISRSQSHVPFFDDIEEVDLVSNLAQDLIKKDIPKKMDNTNLSSAPIKTNAHHNFNPQLSQPIQQKSPYPTPVEQTPLYPLPAQPSPVHPYSSQPMTMPATTQPMPPYPTSMQPMPAVAGSGQPLPPQPMSTQPFIPQQFSVQASNTNSIPQTILQSGSAQQRTATQPLHPQSTLPQPVVQPAVSMPTQERKQPYTCNTNFYPTSRVNVESNAHAMKPATALSSVHYGAPTVDADLTMFIRAPNSDKQERSQKVDVPMMKDTKKSHPPRGNYEPYISNPDAKIPMSLPKPVIPKVGSLNSRFYHTNQTPMNRFKTGTMPMRPATKSVLSGTNNNYGYTPARRGFNAEDLHRDWKNCVAYNPWVTEYRGKFKAYIL